MNYQLGQKFIIFNSQCIIMMNGRLLPSIIENSKWMKDKKSNLCADFLYCAPWITRQILNRETCHPTKKSNLAKWTMDKTIFFMLNMRLFLFCSTIMISSSPIVKMIQFVPLEWDGQFCQSSRRGCCGYMRGWIWG